ncbi:hypothetical protein [Aquimarina muelleri]|uniref:Uncharacterized protein n=1 Tax=Aquimarina muelleri TaxID=279356 RepID=A0A918JSZ9_9FLAO|nr:hypothetical protein [Aquimarina muelleri]MCX2763941.1 hypothetical protein [Aquimarina muelleri]GGX11256.1 hypothetical protein GCM10007384_11340 [Aquimarina muelleri]
MLDSNSTYNQLSKEERVLVQQKIVERSRIPSAKEIIAEVLKNINPVVEVKKEKDIIIISKGAYNNIMEMVKKINLKEYWNAKNKQ